MDGDQRPPEHEELELLLARPDKNQKPVSWPFECASSQRLPHLVPVFEIILFVDTWQKFDFETCPPARS